MSSKGAAAASWVDLTAGSDPLYAAVRTRHATRFGHPAIVTDPGASAATGVLAADAHSATAVWVASDGGVGRLGIETSRHALP